MKVQSYVLVGFLNQQMVEADFTEFVDDDGRVRELRILEQRIEQAGLAGPKESP